MTDGRGDIAELFLLVGVAAALIPLANSSHVAKSAVSGDEEVEFSHSPFNRWR